MNQKIILIVFLLSTLSTVYAKNGAQSKYIDLYLKNYHINWGNGCSGVNLNGQNAQYFVTKMLNKLLTNNAMQTQKHVQVVININHKNSPVAIDTEIRINCKKINNSFNLQLKGQINFIQRCPKALNTMNRIHFSGLSSGYKNSYQQVLDGLFTSESEFHMDRPGRFKKYVRQSMDRLINEARDVLIGIKDCSNKFS